MASHSLKRKAEELSALVDRINNEIGAGSTGKKSRLDSGLTPKTKAELLKAFVDQHLNESDEVKSIAPDSPATTLDQVTETPIVLDREAFLRRLQTYSALFTYGKPITPVECARHGWIDTRQYQTDHLVSKLRCELCSGVVYVTDIKHGASEELLHSIREKYLKGLSGLHEKNCIWKYSECDEWVYSFPFYTSYDAVKQWQENLGRLINSNITLPTVQSPLTLEDLKLLEKLLKLEHELDNSGPAADWLKHSQLASSLILPLFGWNLHIIEERPLLKCDLCFRALGLWNYNNTDGTMDSIDAEKEHRPYCPWINRSQAQITSTLAIPYSSQKSATSVCGWEFMLNTIRIECKHLEEMYDLSPKAEQQRRKLHNEAQMLMKAAKSRLTEVLNGKWMKEVAASPVTNTASDPPNEQIAQEPVEQAVQDISEVEAEQLNESASERVQKTSPDNEKLMEDLMQAATNTTDGEYTENIHQVQLESTTEEMIEAPTSPHIPIEVTVSLDETNEQESEVLADEADLVTSAATPELQALEVIRDSAKLGSPGSSLDVNLSTYSSPRHDLVEIDVSAAANEELSIGMPEHEQAAIGTVEEILHAEEPVTEVEQEISQSLESDDIPQVLESSVPSSVVSQVEESEVKQHISEADENITDANVSDGNTDTTEKAYFTETIDSQLNDEAQISAFDVSETINQSEEEHIEEQIQEQVEAQDDSSTHVDNFESTVVDEEIEEQMIATEDNTDDTMTADNVAKETGQEGIEAMNSLGKETDVGVGVDVNEMLVDDHEKTYGASEEVNEAHQDVTNDAQPNEETAEKAVVHETIESANEDDVEPQEHTIEESDKQQVIESESMAVDLTGNGEEQAAGSTKDVPHGILATEDDDAVADDTEGTENMNENIAEDEGEVADESIHEDVATDHMMEEVEVVENTIDDENKLTAADTHMETQADVLEEEDSENAVHTDNDMSQYVEVEALSETQAPEEQIEGAIELEESGETALVDLPIATEQVSTPSAFAGYDDIADNHEVLSPATTAAINEQINNMDNDNELMPESEKTGEVDEEETTTETQELQMAEIITSSDNDANDVMVDSNPTMQHQDMDDEVVRAAVDASDDHENPDFSEAEANEEQEQSDLHEDVPEGYETSEEQEQSNLHEDIPEGHETSEKQEQSDLHEDVPEGHETTEEQEQNNLHEDVPEGHETSEEQEQSDLHENVPEGHETSEEQEQNDLHEDFPEEHMQTGEVEALSMHGNTILVQESNVANAKDDVIPAHNEDVQEIESAEQVSSDTQEVKDDDQAQAFDERDDNIPIQVEDISSDAAEQQSIELANQEASDDYGVEQEVAESIDHSTETIEDVLSGDIDQSGHHLKIKDAPQDEDSEQENITAKDQDIKENEQQEGVYTLQEHISEESQVPPSEAASLTTASEQGASNDKLLNNKVSIEVDGNALIEEPVTEYIEVQSEVDYGSLAPEDDGQLDDYVDSDQFDTADTEPVPNDSQLLSVSTALVPKQAHDTLDSEQDIVTVQKSRVADISNQNADISDAFELADEDEVAAMFQTETEQPMEGLESVADNHNQMTDPNDAQAPNYVVLNADQNVIVVQAEDEGMDTEEVITEDTGMLDMEEISHE